MHDWNPPSSQNFLISARERSPGNGPLELGLKGLKKRARKPDAIRNQSFLLHEAARLKCKLHLTYGRGVANTFGCLQNTSLQV